MKHTCIIISDDPTSIQSLKQFIESSLNITLRNTFTSVATAISSINPNDKPDCIFVEISDPNLDTLCSSLKLSQLTRSLMYVSANPKHEKEAEKKDFPNFHSLPVQSDESFDYLLEKITNEMKADTSAFFMAKLKKDAKQYAPCYYDSITYIEARKNYVDIVTPECTFTLYCSLSKIEKYLKGKNEFIRIHKSFIISTNAIETANNTYVKVKARKIPIPVGDHYRKNLTSFLDQKSLQQNH